MGRGDRPKVAWAKTRQRKKKEREKRIVADKRTARKGK